MTNDDPFGFDLSAKTDKKRRTKGRRGMTGAFETSTRVCDKAGCEEPAQYRAPKNPRNLDDYFWFCKDHVREYNQNWNYFQGQSEAEFQEFLDNATVWERPTKPFGRATQEQKWARHGIDDPLPHPARMHEHVRLVHERELLAALLGEQGVGLDVSLRLRVPLKEIPGIDQGVNALKLSLRTDARSLMEALLKRLPKQLAQTRGE